MKILVLAQSPKTEHNLLEPLKGTSSWRMFKRWMDKAGMKEEDIVIKNAINRVGAKRLTKKDWDDNVHDYVQMISDYPVIITLGNIAGNVVRKAKMFSPHEVYIWNHYHLPHPSGMNRQLNDPFEHEMAIMALSHALIARDIEISMISNSSL